MSDKAAKRRAAPVTVLLSFFLFAGACLRAPDAWEFFLADAAGNRLGTSLSAGQTARAVYRPEEPTLDQIGFQLIFQDEKGNWEVLSLVVEKPETPAPEVAFDLHAEELPPGNYLLVLIRNDEELSKLLFTIAQPAGTGKQARGREIADQGVSPVSPRTMPPPKNRIEAIAVRRATPPPKLKIKKLVAPKSNLERPLDPKAMPTPESNVERPLDPAAMPTPESNLEPTPEIIDLGRADTGPLPTPEPERLGPGAWDLAPGTEILVYGEGDGYWHPATVVRAYQRVFTVRYFNPELPEVDLEREKFRVRELAEGMEVKIREGDEFIDGVIVDRQGRNFSVALKTDGSMRDVAGGRIVVAAP